MRLVAPSVVRCVPVTAAGGYVGTPPLPASVTAPYSASQRAAHNAPPLESLAFRLPADCTRPTARLQVGSVILGLGTAFAIEGPVNTFLRAQKLFPGPHLYAGAGVVVCWAMAASLVPLMTKGNDSARYGHMAFNALALGFFTWQARAAPPRRAHAAQTRGRDTWPRHTNKDT